MNVNECVTHEYDQIYVAVYNYLYKYNQQSEMCVVFMFLEQIKDRTYPLVIQHNLALLFNMANRNIQKQLIYLFRMVIFHSYRVVPIVSISQLSWCIANSNHYGLWQIYLYYSYGSETNKHHWGGLCDPLAGLRQHLAVGGHGDMSNMFKYGCLHI